MNKEISPEERLFNAIQEGKKGPVRRVGKKNTGGQGDFWNKLAALLKLSSSSEPSTIAPEGRSSTPAVNIKIVNAVLAIILILLICWVGYEAVYQRPEMSRVVVAPAANHSAVLPTEPVEEFKPLDVYLEEVKKKDIFHAPAPEPQVAKEEAAKPVETGPDIKELIKNLSLAGIYEGQSLEAMIEDKELKKTYFVKPGDEIKGVKVKSVLKDRVILQLGTQEAELL